MNKKITTGFCALSGPDCRGRSSRLMQFTDIRADRNAIAWNIKNQNVVGGAVSGDGVANSILAIATLKGGSGKSTVASCLAVHWQLQGRRPVLIDADPQRSLIRLAARDQALAGVPVVEDSTEDVWKTARRLATTQGPVIIDTPGFRAASTLGSLAAADFVIVPVRASPLDVDRMLDTLSLLVAGVNGWRPAFRCLLTQTTRDSVIARHIRAEIAEAGFPLLSSEMPNRVAYSEAALHGTTPTAIDPGGAAARDVSAIADEIDSILSVRQLARQ